MEERTATYGNSRCRIRFSAGKISPECFPVSVSGNLDAVLDVGDDTNLAAFVALIKGFRVSSALSLKANRLGFPLHVIKTVQELTDVLHAPGWRNWPTLFEVPAVSQIFGRIVLDAQIDGILYKSVLTKKNLSSPVPSEFSKLAVVH